MGSLAAHDGLTQLTDHWCGSRISSTVKCLNIEPQWAGFLELKAHVKYFKEFRSKRLQGQLAHFSSRRCHPRRLGLTACA